MSKEYNRFEHTFVLVKHPKCPNTGIMTHPEDKQPFWEDEAWRGPMEIVLHTGSHVWVENCYSAEGHSEVKRVGDGRDNGYGLDGQCILSVPAAWCSYYTVAEAEGIMMCLDADDRLLSYAR